MHCQFEIFEFMWLNNELLYSWFLQLVTNNFWHLVFRYFIIFHYLFFIADLLILLSILCMQDYGRYFQHGQDLMVPMYFIKPHILLSVFKYSINGKSNVFPKVIICISARYMDPAAYHALK